jgi:glucose/arabinose dehydrogenase
MRMQHCVRGFVAVLSLCLSPLLDAAIQLTPVVSGLSSPVFAANAGDGTNRLFIVEQAGVVRVLQPGASTPTTFLDIQAKVVAGGEQGLLGLAFHPEYSANGRFFVYYTRIGDGTLVIAEYQVSNDPDVAGTGEIVLLTIPHPTNRNHNGGMLAFGPDRHLYIGVGDGGAGNDPPGNAQNIDVLLGKILRIDVDGTPDDGSAYRIPDDNPFLEMADARPEIWFTGLRNPWRMRFDGATGDLWIGDVGQGAWEEIDVARAGEGGLNFGWNRLEGFECFEPRSGCNETGFTPPVAAYGHDFGCAVIGGVVVRDPDQPLLDGGYVFSDSCSGILWVLDAGDTDRQEPTIVAESNRSISSIELDEDGTVLATDRGSGELVRILAAPR